MPIHDGISKPAPYAARAEDSQGRKYQIAEGPGRSAFQRDRDRIIHSTAFRRLQHKTQVFANLDSVEKTGDHYRTRLTHTIEVTQISRTIARVLSLNEDFAEAVALAHDLGHTPFGHAGEEVLNMMMAHDGGFNHNIQSLRVIDFLEKRYPNHFGLNLTYEVREAVIKHESNHDISVPDEFNPDENPLLEGQIVNLADEIAYHGHDVDDGLGSGLLTLEMMRDIDFLAPVMDKVKAGVNDKSEEMIRYAFVRHLVNMNVLDLTAEIKKRINEHDIETISDVRQCPHRIISFSDEQSGFNNKLKQFLRRNIYHHSQLNAMKEQSFEIISFLFSYFLEDISRIPEGFRKRFPDVPHRRLTVDYIAGMTDRFAQNEFVRNC
ncbi:MAG: deoxyguanosinetriphosphate triphosphohydrolase [candidate division Zixibacteria bacterium]